MGKNKQEFIRITYNAQFLRIGQISGMYYAVPGRKTKRIVVYGIGAPLPPDEGKLSDASVILDYDTDLYVPDYIGFGRSDGKFTPMNCVKTFLSLYEDLTQGVVAVCNYEDHKVKLQYNEIHFVGRSFGGAYISLLPKYNNKIKNLCLIYPVVDPLTWVPHSSCRPGEETYKNFMNSMIHDGYKNLYRGITSILWQNHFKNKDKLSPMNNIKYLKRARVFIGHGGNDNRINFLHSLKYYRMITKKFSSRLSQFKLKIYKNGDHNLKTSNKAIKDYLTWMGVPKTI